MYYTCEEIAKMFRVSLRTVYNWIKSGKLPAAKIGRDYRITDDDIKQFEANSRKKESEQEEVPRRVGAQNRPEGAAVIKEW